ncbi:MAG: NAD-dependent epimerase/dehydratase family protein [Nitrospira sp.]|nr:NAD-dependent epimerase/dehydratase family protein [Nitrospira sp.]
MSEAIDEFIRGESVFLTGGRGFIGTHLTRRLLARGNRVTIYDNGHRDSLRYSGLDGAKGLTVVSGDVLDRPALEQALGSPSYVLHLAAIAGVSSYFKKPLRTMEVNFGGTQNMLSCLKDKPGLRLFVGFSTSEIYGPEAHGVREEDPTSQGNIADRRWVYAISKLASEKLGYAYFWEYGLPTCYVRPFNVYGPGQVGEGAVSLFIYRALRGLPLRVTGDGSQVRAFCYIEDFCDAVETCLVRAEFVQGTSFNLGNPAEPVTMRDLAERIIKLTGSQSAIQFVPHAGEDVRYRSPSIERAARELKFKPGWSLDDGLKATIEWFHKVDPAAPE